jgi:polyisoprenoid-binding protein YceI
LRFPSSPQAPAQILQESFMHRMSRLFLVAAPFVALTVPMGAAAALSDAGGTHVRFLAIGPAGMKITGEASTVKVIEEGPKVTIVVPLTPLQTGISLRDSHMREKYLEVSKFPDARLSVARSALKLPQEGASSEGDAPGELSLHGRTRPVKVHYHVKLAGGVYQASGTLRVDMTEYGIETPGYLGVSVKPGVDITVEFQAKDR